MKNGFLGSALLLCAAVFTSNAQTHSVTIPSGTALAVRTLDPIEVASAQPGSKYRATLAHPLRNTAGAVVIPSGAPVQLMVVSMKKSNRISGRDRVDLRVNSIMYRGREYPVVSSVAESKGNGKGKRTLSRTGIGAGAGALIGGIAGGGTGAAVGALVGGGGGTAVAAATGGKHLTIPPETVLSFQLNAPLNLH